MSLPYSKAFGTATCTRASSDRLQQPCGWLTLLGWQPALTDDHHVAVRRGCRRIAGGVPSRAGRRLGQVVHAGEQLRDDAALHLALRVLPLGRDCVDLVCAGILVCYVRTQNLDTDRKSRACDMHEGGRIAFLARVRVAVDVSVWAQTGVHTCDMHEGRRVPSLGAPLSVFMRLRPFPGNTLVACLPGTCMPVDMQLERTGVPTYEDDAGGHRGCLLEQLPHLGLRLACASTQHATCRLSRFAAC